MEHIDTFAMQHIAGFKPSFPEKILENSSNVLPSPSFSSFSTVQSSSNTISISARKEQLNEIRKYLQNQDSFQVKDLTKQFTDIPYHSIIDLIGREKKNGKIYMIAKGTYSKYHNNTNISKKQKIREYILTLQEFSSSDIQKHFSDVHYQSIILVIRQMKKENLIKSTSYGNYKVIAS